VLAEAWNVAQNVRRARSKVIHCDQMTHPPISGVHILMIEDSVLIAMAGLIVQMLFMLFFVYNAA